MAITDKYFQAGFGINLKQLREKTAKNIAMLASIYKTFTGIPIFPLICTKTIPKNKAETIAPIPSSRNIFFGCCKK